MSDLYIARTSGVVMVKGKRYPISRGRTVVRSGHPVFEGNEELFAPLTVHYDTETASSAPGERRSVSRAKKKNED